MAALAPEPGEDVGKLAKQFPASPAGASIRVTEGFAQLDEKAFIEYFAPDIPSAQARVLAASQGPIEKTLFDQKTTVAAWKEKPSWYAVSTKDRVINPDLERFFAKRMNAYTVEMDASHASPVSQPNAIAELIKLAARLKPHFCNWFLWVRESPGAAGQSAPAVSITPASAGHPRLRGLSG